MRKRYETLASPSLIRTEIHVHVTTPGEGPGLVIGYFKVCWSDGSHYSVGTKKNSAGFSPGRVYNHRPVSYTLPTFDNLCLETKTRSITNCDGLLIG